MKRKKIVIIGAVGTAVNLAEQVQDAITNYGVPLTIKGFLIDSAEQGDTISGFNVLGGLHEIKQQIADASVGFIFCLYKQDILKERYNLLMQLEIPEERFFTFVHPLAYVSKTAEIGRGTVIFSNSTVQSNVVIGPNCIINSNTTIEHDTIIGKGCFLAAGITIGSKVVVGNHCFLGLNSSIREGVCLGDSVFVGMHSLVLKDYTNCIIAGVPANKKTG